MVIEPRPISENATLEGDLHPLLKRIYQARNISDANQLDYGLNRLLPYQQLKNIDEAVALLSQALKQQQRILIVADFDADGATSCALAIRGLMAMGARHVEYIVPNRFEYGYGLTPEIVELATGLEPDVIITVDNGISSIDGVRTARQHGIDVLVTDHHLAGPELPDANVIINPNQPGCEYPSKAIAGVGVMFNVLIALRAGLREQHWFEQQGIQEPNLAEFLDLVALGTVADVVPLDHNNRILIAQGLSRIRKGYCAEGIKALAVIAKRTLSHLKTADLGFAIAPRLNAAGRLTDMSLGIECLLSNDQQAASEMATQLDELNQQRKQIQQDMQEQANQALERNLDIDPTQQFGLCLFHTDWHPGVVGILASKIKEQYHRPVIAFAEEGEGMLKGSARSIPGVHIRDVLESIYTQRPGLIDKFGGHAMAAGLTLATDDLHEFTQQFNSTVEANVHTELLQDKVYTDGELSAKELNIHTARLLEQSGPWGQGFPEPLFQGVFEITSRKIVGEHHLKLQLKIPQGTQVFEAIAFQTTDEDWPTNTRFVDAVYRLEVNEYFGRTRLQLSITNILPKQSLDPE